MQESEVLVKRTAKVMSSNNKILNLMLYQGIRVIKSRK